MTMKNVMRHDAAQGMGRAADPDAIDLDAGQTWGYSPDGDDVVIVPIDGAVWITQTAGVEDLILRRGESFRSRGNGRVVVEPVTMHARVAIRRAAHETSSETSRLTRESPASRLRHYLRVFFAGAGAARRAGRRHQPAGY